VHVDAFWCNDVLARRSVTFIAGQARMSFLCRRQMQVPPVAFSSRRHFYGHSWSSQCSYYSGCSTLSTDGLSRLPRTSHANNFWRKNGGIGLRVVVASDGAASSSRLVAPIAVERLRTPRLMTVRALRSKASSTAQEPPDRKEVCICSLFVPSVCDMCT